MFLTLILFCSAAASAPGIYTQSPAEVDAWLKAQSASGQTFDARLHETVAATLGTPYHDGPLGEGPGATPDPDPLIDLTRVDCVTFIEQNIALAASPDLLSATDFLQKIRYKGGKVDFETRNHFFEADWLRNNTWCKDISTTLGVETVSLTRTIDRKDFFKRVGAEGLGTGMAPEQVTIQYIPSAMASKVESKIPVSCIIAFVGKVDWLFSLHCGLWLKDEQGGKLCHASSKSGKAVSMDLSEYVDSQASRYLGFIVYKVNAPR